LKVPRKLRIIGREFTIAREHESLFRENCYGTIEWDECKIRLREKKPYFMEFQEAQTLMHEIVHGIDFSFGIGLDEAQTTRLSTGLMAVIRDNQLDFRKPDNEK
jgi:hypothetical protein